MKWQVQNMALLTNAQGKKNLTRHFELVVNSFVEIQSSPELRHSSIIWNHFFGATWNFFRLKEDDKSVGKSSMSSKSITSWNAMVEIEIGTPRW